MIGPRTAEVAHRKGFTKRGQMQAVRIGDFVGVRYDIRASGDPLRLYNVTADPHEDHDLAALPQYRNTLEQMNALLVTARIPDADAPRPYDTTLLPAAQPPRSPGRLDCRLFEGRWPWVPQFGAQTAASSKETPGFALPETVSGKDFGAEFSGFIQIPEDGAYTFAVQSDSGAVLRIHDALVVDDDFQHGDAAKTGTILLKAGWHPVRLHYRHDPAKGEPHLQVTLSRACSDSSRPVFINWGH
jgi:hypothetical protein